MSYVEWVISWYPEWYHSIPCIDTLRLRQHGYHFTDNTFKLIFLNENVIISIKITLKFVPKGPINNIPALVQIMGWRRPGDKPLSEAMMVSLLMQICVTRPQWVNILWPSDAISHCRTFPSLALLMACHMFSAKHLLEPMMNYYRFMVPTGSDESKLRTF